MLCSRLYRTPTAPTQCNAEDSLLHGDVSGLAKERAKVVVAQGVGPSVALKRTQLSSMSGFERDVWVQKARLEAILGSMSQSMASLRSGLRCYVAFIGIHVWGHGVGLLVASLRVADACFPGTKAYFPPSLNTLLAWSVLFRSGGTWRNYLGYVKTGCIIVNVDTQVLTMFSRFACGFMWRHVIQYAGVPVTCTIESNDGHRQEAIIHKKGTVMDTEVGTPRCIGTCMSFSFGHIQGPVGEVVQACRWAP